MGRKVKACVPCHERKVRCDAMEVGTPCSRCVDSRRTDLCIMLNSKALEPCAQENEPATPSHMSMSGDANHTLNDSSSSHTTAAVHFVSNIDHETPSHSSSRSSLQNQQLSPRVQIGLNRSYSQSHTRTFEFIHEVPALSSTFTDSPDDCEDMIDYHDGTNSMTILTEALGPDNNNTLVQKAARGPNSLMESQDGLCDIDANFLRSKGAYDLPPRQTCDKLLRIFFDSVYIRSPILDPVKLMEEYSQQNVSMFLLLAILTTTIQHASFELIQELGFDSHSTAQETFFKRTKLLHDFDVEKNQLRLLQGSLLLSTTHISHYMQRDYRYWLSNATYIATKMGLHRNVVGQRLDGSTRKLFRRIWCILYSWDVLLALNGMDTMRRFRDSDSETCTAEITEDDWEDEPIPEVFQEFLHPIKNVEKSYVIEGGKLSLLIAQFWQRFSSTPLDACYTQLTVAMDSWRESLPPSFRTPAIQETSVVNTWNLILMARGYVCECIMHRMIIRSAGTNESLRLRAGQKLSSALFELNTIIDRIMNQNTGQFNSWVLHGFISTALALHVEKALNPALTSLERSMTNLRIQVNLEFLRDMAKTWSYIGVMVRVFEGVIRRYGLVTSLPESESIPNDIGAFPQQSPDVLNLLGTPTMPRPNPWMFGPADKNIALDLGMGDLNANSVLEELLYDNTLSWDISKLI